MREREREGEREVKKQWELGDFGEGGDGQSSHCNIHYHPLPPSLLFMRVKLASIHITHTL